MTDRWGGVVSDVDFSERWLGDGLRIVDPPGGIFSLSIDMSNCALAMKRLKAAGRPVTYAPVIICTAAEVWARHPELQKLIAGNKKLSGGTIDICLSISGNEVLTPVVIFAFRG